jgi:hypothetical protein
MGPKGEVDCSVVKIYKQRKLEGLHWNDLGLLAD